MLCCLQGSLENDPTWKFVSAFHHLYQEPSGYQSNKHEAACRSAKLESFPSLEKNSIVDYSKCTERWRTMMMCCFWLEQYCPAQCAFAQPGFHFSATEVLVPRKKGGFHSDQWLNVNSSDIMIFVLHLALLMLSCSMLSAF